MSIPLGKVCRIMTFLLLIDATFVICVSAQPLVPGRVVDMSFPDANLPPTLHSMMTGETVVPTMSVRLPDDYDSSKTYPLLVYVPGFDGG